MSGKTRSITKQASGITYSGTWTGLSGGTATLIGSPNINESRNGLVSFVNATEPTPCADQAGASAVLLTDGNEFDYDDYIDSNGAKDIFDTGISGALGALKYIRIVHDGKSIGDPTGLNLKVRAKDLSVNQNPPEDECYVDPVLGYYLLPRPVFYHKMEDEATVDIELEGYTYLKSLIQNTSGVGGYVEGKFGDAGRTYVHGNNRSITYRHFPFGDVSVAQEKGATSFWFKGYSGIGYVTASSYNYFRFYINDNTYVEYYMREAPSFTLLHEIRIFVNGVEQVQYDIDLEDQWIHFFIAWDKAAGLAGGKTIRVWVNGTELVSTTVVPTNAIKYYIDQRTLVSSLTDATVWCLLDNWKLWDYIIEDPNFEYNAGAGDELNMYPFDDALLENGFYYIADATDPAGLVIPDGTTNDEVQLEDPTNEDNAKGEFGTGPGKFISGTNPAMFINPFVEDVDFYYDEELDGTGTNAIDLYDDSDSGAMGGGSGKHFRIVNAGDNVSKTTGGTLDLALVPMAKNLANGLNVPNPPVNQVYIDPIRGKFVLPRPLFWSKCESMLNMTSVPEISNGLSEWDDETQITFEAGKFTNGLKMAYGVSNVYNRSYFPLGEDYEQSDAGVLSFWYKATNENKLDIHIGSLRFMLEKEGVEDRHGIQVGSATPTYDATAVPTAWSHYYLIWDVNAGIGGTDTARLYKDGVELIGITDVLTNFGDIPNIELKLQDPSSTSATIIYIDNIKIWDHIPVVDPAWLYNTGTGRESALHYIYGSANEYNLKLTSGDFGGVGYYLDETLIAKATWEL